MVTDPWLRNFIDLECFVLSGMPAKDTICAEMAFMFMERNKPDSTIDYPLGGSAALVAALVRGIEKNGGRVMLRAPVDTVVMEGGRAAGVRLKSTSGDEVRPLRAVRRAFSSRFAIPMPVQESVHTLVWPADAGEFTGPIRFPASMVSAP